MCCFVSGQRCRHRCNFRLQCLDFAVVLREQRLLLLDFLGIYHHFFRWNQGCIKMAFLIIITIAIVNPLNEFKQVFQRKQCICLADGSFCVNREIPQLDDIRELCPCPAVYCKAERFLMNQGLQIVPIWHTHGIVCGIDPFHSKFQCLSAANRTHRRRGGKHVFGFDGGFGK